LALVQGTQAEKASVLYQAVSRQRAPMTPPRRRNRRPSSSSANGRPRTRRRGVLLYAKLLYEVGDKAGAKTQLQWVIDHAGEDELKGRRPFRIAQILLDEKQYDQALKTLDAKTDEGVRRDLLRSQGRYPGRAGKTTEPCRLSGFARQARSEVDVPCFRAGEARRSGADVPRPMRLRRGRGSRTAGADLPVRQSEDREIVVIARPLARCVDRARACASVLVSGCSTLSSWLPSWLTGSSLSSLLPWSTADPKSGRYSLRDARPPRNSTGKSRSAARRALASRPPFFRMRSMPEHGGTLVSVDPATERSAGAAAPASRVAGVGGDASILVVGTIKATCSRSTQPAKRSGK